MAPRPSSCGISRSIVTASGSCWWTLRTASKPSRAVATTRNSPATPAAPPSTSLNTRRISALSSTTRTLGRRSDDDGIGAHRPDLDASVGHMEPHRPPRPPAHRLARHGDPRPPQSLARRHDVALAHLDRAPRHELREHTGAPGEFGDEGPGLGASGRE